MNQHLQVTRCIGAERTEFSCVSRLRVGLRFRRHACPCVSALLVSAVAFLAGCGDPPGPKEVAVPWDNFESHGWYAVDPAEYGDCAAGLTKLESGDATEMQLDFDFEPDGLNFATFRNHELERSDWMERRALVVDVENKTESPLRMTVFLSNEESEPVWHQSVQHRLPSGVTRDLRFGLRPVKKTRGAPKDWTEDAWQFAALDITNIQRIAFRIHGEEGTAGNIVVSNPRFMKLATPAVASTK